MSLSNYPPGITGNEPEIAGCDETTVTCEDCGAECEGFGQWHHSPSTRSSHGDFNYECTECGMAGTVHTVLEPDEDEGRDR